MMAFFSWLRHRRLPPPGVSAWRGMWDERGPVVFVEGAVPGDAVVPDSWRVLPYMPPDGRSGVPYSGVTAWRPVVCRVRWSCGLLGLGASAGPRYSPSQWGMRGAGSHALLKRRLRIMHSLGIQS